MEKSENKEYSQRHIWVRSHVEGIGDSWYRGGCDEMTPDKLQKLMEEHNATAYYEDNFYDNVKDIPFKPAHQEIETFGMPTGNYITTSPTVTVVPKGTVIENPLGYSNTKRFKFPEGSKDVTLTKKEAKALRILKEHPCISAKAFACFYYTEPEHEYLFTACSKQGNGACRGKKAWLCAGSYLGRLRKKGYVQLHFINDSFHFDITSHGEQMLRNHEN